MASINIGCNFTKEHVDAILKLRSGAITCPRCDGEGRTSCNEPAERDICMQCEGKGWTIEETVNQVTDVYGSPGGCNPLGSVRPTKREASIEWQEFRNAAQRLREAGVEINLTLNSLFPHYRHAPGLNLWSDATRTTLEVFIEKCSLIGPMNYIVAHPALLDILHEQYMLPASARIIISTVMNVHSLAQLKWIKERWPCVKRVCPALWKNRDFQWLKRANEIIPLELLANEFCSMRGVECEGLFRQACYLGQSMDVSQWSALDVCSAERKAHPESWLMARFVLPQWIPYYVEQTGVKHFKVTGRTHPASFIYDVGLKYVQGKAEGNLLNLWGQLEATRTSVIEEQVYRQHEVASNLYIPIEKLDYLRERIYTCSVGDKCGIGCQLCKEMWKEIEQCQKTVQ